MGAESIVAMASEAVIVTWLGARCICDVRLMRVAVIPCRLLAIDRQQIAVADIDPLAERRPDQNHGEKHPGQETAHHMIGWLRRNETV